MTDEDGAKPYNCKENLYDDVNHLAYHQNMCNASNPIGYCKPDGNRRHHNVTHCVTNPEPRLENSALLQHLIMCPVNSEFK